MAADENNEKSSDSRNLRLYSSDGQRSARMECDSQTSCGDICQHFSADCVTLQIGNFHFRQLKSDTSPLTILTDFCRILCMSEDAFGESSSSTADQLVRSVMAYTDSSSFRHIFSFFLGRPRIRSKSSLTSSGILSEEVLMRKGKLLPTWSNANAVFHNSTIRIQTKQNQDEILHLRSMKIDVQESKRGRGIRFRGSDTSNQYLLIFQRPNILQLWLSKAQQIEKSSHIDLSDEQLTLIPENVLNNEGDIQVLNLRRNSLISRPQTEKTMSHLGYVDDLYRIQSLQVVDLSANQIVTFPIQLTLLAHLRQINLSSNFIGTVPKEVGNMRRLQYLNLSNNLIDSIPNEIVNCFNLVSFDLSFNQFSQVPDCLNQLKIDMWRLSGNNIEKIDRVGHVPTDKLDLRRNILDTSFRLDIENVTHLDIRDNSLISTVHLTNLRFLKTIRCERLQLTSLHLNGESLTHIFADHNLLDSLVVMPLPEGLQTLSISYNHFRCLPDWISDCQHLNFLRANNNRLEVLPDRIFCSTSLKCIFAFDNLIQQLPDEAESNCLETLILYKNRINKLPRHFFGMMPKLRQLNISSNFIEILPYIDLNLICRIQIFRAANNCLTENCVPIIINMKQLKVLDLSHNFLCSFDDSALTSLDLLEEINVSSNRLTRLSGCFGTLPNLQILRAHSNRLVDIPHLATCQQLHTIDVSSNMISLGSLEFQAPPTLRHFDVTCNSGDFVTDQNWLIPKMNMINIADGQHSLHEFQIGVSGSRGSKNKQCIRQLRVNNTFAFIDGGSNFYMSSSICRFLSQHLREHPDDDIRTTLLKCHCELGEEGERLGASVLILQLSGANIEIASIGTICVVLSKNGKFQFVIDGRYEIDDDEYSRIREAHGFVDEENRINGIVKSSRQIGHFAMFPIVLPTHFYKNLINDETIDGLIIANSSLWSMMTIDDVSDVFNNNRSPIVIAKKLQDKLQSFDYGGNSNILVMRRIKPQIIFQNHIDEDEKLDEVAVAMPAIVSPTVSTPIPATRATYRTPSPPPPPLPTSTPPIFEEDEEEAMQIEMKSTYSLSIDRYQETISKRQFNETRDLLSKSLKLSPPSTVTFNI